MSIGATLAAARRRADLTVGEVSRQTRIREALIRGIERDDYAGCGGDFYARGHIRSIAQAVGVDPAPLIQEYDAAWRNQEEPDQEETAAADDFLPTAAMRLPDGRRPGWPAVLVALVVLGLISFAGFRLIGAAKHSGGGPVSAARPSPAHHRRASPRPRPAVSHVPAVRAPAGSQSRILAPVSAQAFGPAGPGRGDDPQQAALAIDAHPADGWHTAWYTTPHFGNLQSGTGLLLDMGRPVTIMSAQVRLSGIPGADLQLRAGGAPELAALRPVAGAQGAGGLVRLSLARPARARYVLIWFTRLPPDQNGTFQVSVYHVNLRGRPN